MSLGAYCIVRYSDDFRDERVNVGVVVWHPTEGFEWRFLPSLDRVHAVNPSIKTRMLRQQLGEVERRLQECDGNGREIMSQLASWLREGLQFSNPYPTKIMAATDTVTRLYDMLVPPPAPEKQAEVTLQVRLSETLRNRVRILNPQSPVEDLGDRWIQGVRVPVGIHTSFHQVHSLWRAVSLRARSHDDQIARAKSAAMDITKLNALAEFNNYRHRVAVDSPPRFAGFGLEESKRWLSGVGADVLEIRQPQDLHTEIDARLN